MLIYLSNLSESVSKVCPIDGIADLGNGQFRIDYKEEATEAQKQAAQVVISEWPLESAKLNKLSNINSEWSQVISNGWDSGQGKLGLGADDVALLSGAFSLAKEASNMGLPLPSIITMEDTQIDFNNIQEMTMLMLRYGAARAEISKTFANRRRAVEAATTIEEVNEA